MSKVIHYDERGNLIYCKYDNGYEFWNEYDKNNNCIHYKNSNGFEYWREFDERDNLIHLKDSDGNEFLREFDENNNEIHYKDSNGFEYWREFDERDNLIHFKDSDDCEYWYEYDKNNNCIHYKNSNGYEEWKKYDENNNLIHYKDSNEETIAAARLGDLDDEQKDHIISEFRGFKRLYTIDDNKIISTDYALFEKNNGEIFKFPYSMISDCTYFYNNDDDLLLLDANTDKPYMNIIFKINLPAIGIINNDFAIIKVSDIKKAIHYILDYTVISKIDKHINKISENENYTTYRLDTDLIKYNFIPKFAPVIEYDDNINNILSRFIERINNRDKILLPQNLKTDFIIVDRDLLEYIEKEIDIYNECYTFAINKLSTKGYIPKIYKIYTGKCIENRLLHELDFGIHTDKYLFTIPSFLSTILKRLK